MAESLKNAVDFEEDDMKGRFLTFLVDKELYGIGLRNVMEIVGYTAPSPQMPEMPDYIKGYCQPERKNYSCNGCKGCALRNPDKTITTGHVSL